MFKKKNIKCENCRSKINKEFSFCPYCGDNLIDEEQYKKDYGMLGKVDGSPDMNSNMGFGITDKLIGSLMNSVMKNLDKQFRNIEKDQTRIEKAEIKSFPNGIRIRINPGGQVRKKQETVFQRQISEKQMEKMSTLPRAVAKTKVRRLNDRIIYELNTSGVESTQDIFVSKLESGYEIKAIGDKKVYVNSLPINLPLKNLSLDSDKLFIEFLAYQN